MAVADALERLGLSMPVGILAVVRVDLPVLLPVLPLGCPSCARTLAAFRPRAAPFDIPPYAFRANARQLLPASLRTTAEGFAPITASPCRAIVFLLAS
jgi:hypothetical protein